MGEKMNGGGIEIWAGAGVVPPGREGVSEGEMGNGEGWVEFGVGARDVAN